MPNYDYRCPNGHTFDKIRPMGTQRDAIKCPECGLPGKLLPAAPLLGWHQDSGRVYKEKRRRPPV